MIQRLNQRMRRVLNRPIRAIVDPTPLCVDGGFPVCIEDDFHAKLRETFREMSHKQFSSTVVCIPYAMVSAEWWDAHFLSLDYGFGKSSASAHLHVRTQDGK